MSTILSTLFAADYPFLEVLWTMLIFFLWVMWFWLLIVIIGDVFRRHDIGGGKKTICQPLVSTCGWFSRHTATRLPG